MPITLEIVSPARLVLSRAVDMVVMPAYEGDLAAMENHAPMITLLRGGVAEITAERCTILADDAVPAAELSAEASRRALDQAEQAWTAVDKADINARDAALDRLQSTREAVRVATTA
jgi:F-type H+-transporting ATPase subunit epsilon